MQLRTLPKSGVFITVLILSICVLMVGCNAPPLYEKRARDFLTQQGVDPGLIKRLTKHEPISADEAYALAGYDHVPVLHLVAANTATPSELLLRLSSHENFEVRTGIAGTTYGWRVHNGK